MNITFEQFKQAVTMLKVEHDARDKYIDQVPHDIQSAVFDNYYTNSLGIVADRLADMLFAEYADDVAWFLYECDYDRIARIEVEDRVYIIDSIETYFAYAEQEMKFI